MSTSRLLIGLDFGTDSVRGIAVNGNSGAVVCQVINHYKRWSDGEFCDASVCQFRQHPLDYLESMEGVLTQICSELSESQRLSVCGISVDTTGSSPVAVNRQGTPLALLEEYRQNPDAMFFLWKDHSAVAEAESISRACKHHNGPDYTQFCGGSYSSEWYWSKLLYFLNHSPELSKNVYAWVEHCDWMTGILCGETKPEELKRSQCAAGHKAMWHESWQGLPAREFLEELHPELYRIGALPYKNINTSEKVAGTLAKHWCNKFTLPENVCVSVGILDAHAGAIGGGIEPGTLLKVIGTSTCDMVVAPYAVCNSAIAGIAGQAKGSILPEMVGLEAGQSAFGDIYAWFKQFLMWPLEQAVCSLPASEKDKILCDASEDLLSRLTAAAQTCDQKLVAVDWWNGRRTPYLNIGLTGCISGFNLGTTPADVFRALVHSTVFGSRAIFEHFRNKGVEIKEVRAVGGVAKKSPYIMQTLADALAVPVHVIGSDQACALGAVINSAVASGLYSSVPEAQTALSSTIETSYTPNHIASEVIEAEYRNYLNLCGSCERLFELFN